MAIELLGEVKAPGAKERLLTILKTPEDDCRGAAARGLGRLGDQNLLDELASVLAEQLTADDVKLDVAEGMLRLDVAKARERLTSLALADDDSKAELATMLKEFTS